MQRLERRPNMRQSPQLHAANQTRTLKDTTKQLEDLTNALITTKALSKPITTPRAAPETKIHTSNLNYDREFQREVKISRNKSGDNNKSSINLTINLHF